MVGTTHGGAAHPTEAWEWDSLLGNWMPSGYLSVTIFRTRRLSALDREDAMLSTMDEGRALLRPLHERLLRWHEDGYKDRRRTMAAVADQWAAQDGVVIGGWTRNLILARADADQSPECYRDKDARVDVIRVHETDGRLAAQLRLRRVQLHAPWPGQETPRIPTPSTDAAEDWFGNKHLHDPRQIKLFDDDSHVRPHTNLLVGRTENELLGEFERLFVICYTGPRLAWHYEVGESDANLRPLPRDPAPDGLSPRPKYPMLDIQPKQEPS